MQPSTLITQPPLAIPAELRGYRIELDLCDGDTSLRLAGDLDAAATDALRGILTCVQQLPGIIRVQADEVVGADLEALDPLLEAAAVRRRQRRPGVVFESISDAVRDLFDVLLIPARPPVELGAA